MNPMPLQAELSELLACPRCDTAIDTDASGYRCRACKTRFPLIGGIPWLFAEPDAALDEWRGRLHFAIQQLTHESKRLEAAMEAGELRELTRLRLERQSAATVAHRDKLRTVLAPLGIAPMQATYESYLALRTRLPADQGLNTYYANVHRDWSWGEEENDASLGEIRNVLEGDQHLGDTLVLGAGACRLAHDIHMQLGTARTIAVDFNPLLMLIARAVIGGEPLELYEFPIAPRSMDDFAVLRHLSPPAEVRDGFHLLLADALRPPLGRGTIDTVVTPWLIDIVAEDLPVFAARVNGLLKPGGRWISFGSLAFNDPAREHRYCREETLAIVEENGFAKPKVSEARIPYMCSPASRHGRRELTFAFGARKTANAERPPRHTSLPDWIVTGKEPVPLLPAFHTQAMSTQIYAFIMALIDGKRSLRDMARSLEQQRLMPAAEAEPAIRNFLIRMYEDAQRNPGF